MRILSVIMGVLLLSAGIGCNTAANEQAKAEQAQREANEKTAEANREANDKIIRAQAEADRKAADAQARFFKMREDYRHDIATKLVSLDQKISDAEAKSRTAAGKAKTDLDARIKQIHAEREVFGNDFKGLTAETASTWDKATERLNKEWDHLKDLVDHA